MRRVILAVLLCGSTLLGLTLGQIPKSVVLKDGLVSGGDWELHKDKVQVVFYADPDEKNINDDFSRALKASNLDKDKFDVVVIVNVQATWIPKFVILTGLKKEQEKESHVAFVVDVEKILVKEWGLKDERSTILVFDKTGKLIYRFVGKIDKEDITKVLGVIREAL